MAKENLTTEVRKSLADDMRATHSAVYAIQAMAEGAAALLEKFDGNGVDDSDGLLWSARLLAEQISAEVTRVIGRESELELFDRVKQLEGVAA